MREETKVFSKLNATSALMAEFPRDCRSRALEDEEAIKIKTARLTLSDHHRPEGGVYEKADHYARSRPAKLDPGTPVADLRNATLRLN
jgi:hypothetical protein